MGKEPNVVLEKKETVQKDKHPSNTILQDYWPLIVCGALFVTAMLPVLSNWWVEWFEDESYYSHGPLVPLIAAFMVWINRSKLAQAKVKNNWYGIILLLAFVPMYAVGLLMEWRTFYVPAFYFGIFGTMLVMLGWRVTRILIIPSLFMITMMPAATWILDNATGGAQLVSATVAAKFLALTSGYNIIQNGNEIISAGLPEKLLVGSPCSGLRLLISLVTFCWFFIYVTQGARWKKVILMLTALPLSVFINSLRITMIGYVGFGTGSSDAMHTFHDYSGYIGLAICFFILFGIAKLLKMGDFYMGESISAEDAAATSWPKPVGTGLPFAVVGAILLIAVAVSFYLTPLYDLPKGKLDRAGIPKTLGNWISQDASIDDFTLKALSQGDLLSRVYTNIGDSGRQVHVFVDASLDTTAFHDPHLCLPGGGSQIDNERVIQLTFKEPGPITVDATVLEASNTSGTTIVLYWYMLGDKSYPKTKDLFGVTKQYRSSDLSRVALNPGVLPELRKEVLTRQFTWYRFTTEVIDGETDETELKEFVVEFIENVRGFGK